jgi:lipid-A-disaccharide synthase
MAQLAKAWRSDPARQAVQWALAVAPTVSVEELAAGLAGAPVTLVQKRSYALCSCANAALVCSGTATLETALLGTPFATLYKLNPFTYRLAKLLVKVPHFGLANVVAGRKVVPELLQDEVNPERLGRELEDLLRSATAVRMKRDFLEIRGHLGQPGAAARVVDHLLSRLA